MGNLNSFEKLECWKEAALLRKAISAKTKSFPVEEKYRLTDQLIRASRSVTGNIVEGFGRFHHQENSRFCRISRGSLTEILDHLIVAHEENYISQEELNDLKNKYQSVLQF